jgi:hypothetical protein
MEMLLKHPFLGDFTSPMTMDTYLSKENAKKAVSVYETALGSL